MIDLGLNNARAIVIGAGFIPERAGHGRGTALRLAAAGAAVACVDLDAGRAAAIAAEVEDAGGKAVAIVGDVTVSDEAQRVVDESVAALGGVDVCVDIVGEATFRRSDLLTDEEWRAELAKNLDQVFYVYKAVIPHLIRQGTGGSITTISSVDGIGSSKYHVAYGAAKAGVISMVKTYSEELGPHGIRVNAVAPGNVGGGNWDRPNVGFGEDACNPLAPPRPLDVANAVLFLSSALAARITGQTLVVDGGATTRSPWGFDADHLEHLRGGLPGVKRTR
jgi:NAD(P)-dependent dehydrogenase (short-subunit alcohol dehydrogenase family)